MNNKDLLLKLITKWIYENFGGQEAEDPCYNIELLVDYLLEHIEIIEKESE